MTGDDDEEEERKTERKDVGKRRRIANDRNTTDFHMRLHLLHRCVKKVTALCFSLYVSDNFDVVGNMIICKSRR